MPACTQCTQEKAPTEFHPRPDGTKKHMSACKDCDHARRRGWKSLYPDRSAKSQRRQTKYQRARRVGLTVAAFDRLDLTRCEACFQALGTLPDGRSAANLDHCHATGTFRGVLCRSCNFALGFAGDSASRLQQLVEYLGRHGK